MWTFILLALLSFMVFAADFKAPIEITATTTSTLAIGANPFRCYLLIINKGAVSIRVKPTSAHSASEGVLIPAGGNYEPFVAPTNSMFIKSDSSTSGVSIIEGEC